MQTRELDRDNIRVVKTTDMSGTATADEINRGLQIGKKRSLARIAGLPGLRSLMVASLFFALATMPARADDDKDIGHAGADNDKGIRAEIAAVQAQVTSLQSTISALQSQVTTLQTANTSLKNEFNSLQASNAALQSKVNGLQTSNDSLRTQLAAVQANNVLKLGPFILFNPGEEIGVRGPNITFRGANIHIVSGLNATSDNGNSSGLGNLIIGYDEDPKDYFSGGPGGGIPLSPGDRGGSHNLVIGAANRFTQTAHGGLVAGQVNTITGFGATVTGGFLNLASGFLSSVSGGTRNTAGGSESSVLGGGVNMANGTDSCVSGGFLNVAIGGSSNVSGGQNNAANGVNTIVIGGQDNTANNDNSIAPQPPFP